MELLKLLALFVFVGGPIAYIRNKSSREQMAKLRKKREGEQARNETDSDSRA